MLINWQRNNNGGIFCDFLFEICTLLEQCTYLGYLLLEAPREYIQHGPLLSINWLRLCPQSGAHVWSHAIRRRLFIFLMTAAHISPNVFSLRNFLSTVCVMEIEPSWEFWWKYILLIRFWPWKVTIVCTADLASTWWVCPPYNDILQPLGC
jgi:hypothetical protein